MTPLRLLTIALFAAATLPRLAHRGMFVDGVTYASIARNLAEGRGSFWSPSYTATLYPQFHEHPPLGFWLQSLWFRVFGDHLFVERLYSWTVAFATAWVISVIWRRLQGPAKERGKKSQEPLHFFTGSKGGHDREHRRGRDTREDEWVPILLWMAAPAVSWVIVGNLLETTVAFFTTAAIAASLHAALDSSRRAAIGWSALSGVCVVAAFLTKGPVGLFPLVAPVAFLLLPRHLLKPQSLRMKQALALEAVLAAAQRPPSNEDSRTDRSSSLGGLRRSFVTSVSEKREHAPSAIAAQWTTVGACALLLLAWPAARMSLTDYLNQQVIAALAGEREVSGSSVTILKALLQGVLLPMAGVGVLAIAAARRFVAPLPRDLSRALPLLLLGLAGTLPILLSAKQAGHYLVPAVPLYALAAAIVFAPTLDIVADRLETGYGRTLVYVASAIIALGAAGAAVAPGFGRDRGRLADLDAIAEIMPRDQIVGICPESNGDWGLHAWFERRFRAGLDAGGGRGARSIARPQGARAIGRPQVAWFLQTRAARPGCPPAECAAATDPARALVLMTCRRE